LATEIDGVRLVVRPPTQEDRFARFIVLRPVPSREGDLFTLAASGTEDNVPEAMGAAERRAVSRDAGRRLGLSRVPSTTTTTG